MFFTRCNRSVEAFAIRWHKFWKLERLHSFQEQIKESNGRATYWGLNTKVFSVSKVAGATHHRMLGGHFAICYILFVHISISILLPCFPLPFLRALPSFTKWLGYGRISGDWNSVQDLKCRCYSARSIVLRALLTNSSYRATTALLGWQQVLWSREGCNRKVGATLERQQLRKGSLVQDSSASPQRKSTMFRSQSVF